MFQVRSFGLQFFPPYGEDLSGEFGSFLAVFPSDSVPVPDRTSAIPKPLAKAIDRTLVDYLEIYEKSAAEFKQALVKSLS
ncbi:MAG: hypothetical protein JGK17_11390 [Microcoleus sp. PH2017_10_PVI_O_A]|uniref:hypothetical protein n=1 Tax=unclassified Microcoleus TaxID=2642155 RepID=UPI001D97F626|nr:MULTISPECIES: hypothetical protein [unclassified Microcoleus]TAE82473.1 MAG: hypothetical protein EAZ83_12415 [Oscillatoriales cyanobacterium]MCC3406172.1 hypothetical protein [Microcoleus sp. PH2017_10_PVI_O_A]MCC3460763.1 hypothetical protein [Microcoleus sp. PH2017_11_PCY_U_A]MCC3479326.1 hypothetical protein [Microcoleus sp. PH2017_12_PCY_D_A]MCC3529116.1 hypothetical protein [Microcoleus sp. PH2017_21_RUC_O_A]